MKITIDTEHMDNVVFGVMIEKEEYRSLPDFYVKEIVRKVISRLEVINEEY